VLQSTFRNTIHWGIIYWQPTPNPALPHQPLEYGTSLPNFPSTNDPFKLIGYVDAAHGNDLCHHCSTTGYGFMLAGGIFAYRCKTQSITATNLTEAKLLAAVSAGKVTKYL
jgi:hypothetical protein